MGHGNPALMQPVVISEYKPVRMNIMRGIWVGAPAPAPILPVYKNVSQWWDADIDPLQQSLIVINPS